MMIFPQRMRRLTAVVLHEDADALTRKLLNAGVMDFIDVREAQVDLKGRISPVSSPSTEEELHDVRRRIEMFLQNSHLRLPEVQSLDAEQLQQVNVEAAGKELDKLAAEIQQIRDKQQSAQQEINRLIELHRQITLFEEITELIPDDSYVEVRAGSIGLSRLKSLTGGLSGLPVYLHSGEADSEGTCPILLIHMRRDSQRISQVLDRMQWHTIDIPEEFRGMRDTVLAELDTQREAAQQRQQQLGAAAEELVRNKSEWLADTWKNLRMNELYNSMQDHYGKTADTLIFSGWIPSHKSGQISSAVREVSGGRCFLSWSDPEHDSSIAKQDVPVHLEHAKVLSPFQWLVENYSVPRYGTIDPTALVFVTYLVMFGLMFGDAGHGAVLILAGWIIHLVLKRSHADPGSSSARLGELILWCGVSAVVAGVLFGSYFGYSWFPALWFDYHGIVSGHGESTSLVTSIYDILGITIKFGIGILGAGIVMNCINRYRSGDWFHMVFDNGGILGGWFYAGGVYVGFQFVGSGYKDLPSAGILLLTIGLPALLFAAKAPLEFFLEHRSGDHQAPFTASVIMDFLMEWIVELLELFTSYLSNTLSFMRIAGLGIAHVSLMIAFFQIADGIPSAAGSAAVLILGNAVVIILEGLSAGIQALRLHYYEFFSKYFCGSGRVYRPISLRSET
jgi:V/A-type H+/Na+-transporting ATPase subunit I